MLMVNMGYDLFLKIGTMGKNIAEADRMDG
jgi:hypothetical protein